MCRLLGYLGKPILLTKLLEEPPHSLIVQSYQPKEMTAGLLNADGFGIGWYKESQSFCYKNILPIWGDINFPDLCKYIESNCFLANVRSATPGLGVDYSNCQPFRYQNLLFIHNGFIERFRQTVYHEMRDRLSKPSQQIIYGSTDSEHIFGTLIDQLQYPLSKALYYTIQQLKILSINYQIKLSANIILTDGTQLVASRWAANTDVPSLYYLSDHQSVIIASEPLFDGDWIKIAENSILSVGSNFEIETFTID